MLTSGGAIPDLFDYDVILEPSGVLSFILDDSLNTTTFYIFINELVVFIICYWRYTKKDFIF